MQVAEPRSYSPVFRCERAMMDEPADPKTAEARKQSADIKRSADAVEQIAGELSTEADRRTVLSADRTLLASERTYAAWVRTGLAALASGIGATALVKEVLPKWVGQVTGSVLVLFAAFCFIAAVWREMKGVEGLRHQDMRPIPKLLLMPINGLLVLVAIAALVGIWSA